MPDVQVQCIRKSNPERAHEHITHLGGLGWKWPIAQVIRSIDAGDNTFFVLDPRTRQRSIVMVVRPWASRDSASVDASGSLGARGMAGSNSWTTATSSESAT